MQRFYCNLLLRRTRFRQNKTTTKPPAFLNCLQMTGYIVAGLDFRFNCSLVPFWIVIISNTVVFPGYIFIVIVFNENRYASTNIQVGKKQAVILTGPYSIVRHPMYLGLLVMSLFTPSAIGSYWAFIPFSTSILYLVFRIRSEEAMLLQELAGYKDYCTRITYRLIPLIW